MTNSTQPRRFTSLGNVTFVLAINVYMGREEEFTVKHVGDRIEAIVDRWGYSVPRNGELFTEVAEAFHIDRYWKMLEESDVQGYARRCYS